MALFSYRVRFDLGTAPNPFWGVCTLVICKPGIRRRARVGDWVVGTGSTNSPAGDLSGSVVYAMQVTRTLAMREYDAWSVRHPGKRPDPSHPDPRRAVGDSIYDFASDPPTVRRGVHTAAHREHDLSGEQALLSRRFVYFGRAARPLPPDLLDIIKCGPGHKSASIAHLEQRFVTWLESLSHPWGCVLATPAEWLADTEFPAPGLGQDHQPIRSTDHGGTHCCSPRAPHSAAPNPRKQRSCVQTAFAAGTAEFDGSAW